MNIEKLKQERDNWMIIATDKKARMMEYIAFYNFATNRFEYTENSRGEKGYMEKSDKPFQSDTLLDIRQIFDLWLKYQERALAGNGA